MKLLIKKIFLFGLLALSIYIIMFGALYFIRIGNVPLVYRSTQGNVFKGGLTYKKFKEFNPAEKYDIIVLGSSHAYRGYDPEIFASYGYKIYNLGSSAQSLLSSYVIARNYINRDNCNTVIIDLYDRIFRYSSIESLSDITQNVSSDKAAAELCLRSKDLRAINMFTLRMFCKFDKPLNNDTLNLMSGFQASNNQLVLPGNPKDPDYTSNKETLNSFTKLIHYLNNQGIHIILAEHPLPEVYTISESKHSRFVTDINKIIKPYNIKWYDLMRDSTMTGIQYYADENHLNYRGVKKYNHKLIELLIKDQQLPPKSH
ncbi:MAG: hypothetical protein ABI772_00245 [Bacteroidota bacterium]